MYINTTGMAHLQLFDSSCFQITNQVFSFYETCCETPKPGHFLRANIKQWREANFSFVVSGFLASFVMTTVLQGVNNMAAMQNNLNYRCSWQRQHLNDLSRTHIQFWVQMYNKVPTNCVKVLRIYNSTVTNMATMRNFDVISGIVITDSVGTKFSPKTD